MDNLRAPPIDPAAVVVIFGSLSQPSRLAIFMQVLAAGPDGVATKGLADTLGTTGSALTLHLRALEGAGLILVPLRRRGQQTTRVVARIDRLVTLGAWMIALCRDAGWGVDVAADRQIPVLPSK